MRKILLTTVAVTALLGLGIARAAEPEPQIHTLPPAGFYGWVFAPYTTCVPPHPECSVHVLADGLNVRHEPDGMPIASLVNDTPLHVYGSQGEWLFAGIDCVLIPTGLWSDTAGIPLYACRG